MSVRIGDRVDGTSERAERRGPWCRMRLRRGDGRVYLDRWGLGHKRVGHVFLHRMEAPDPGVDLHDHPWWFLSLVVWGGYVEHRADTRDAPLYAGLAEQYPKTCTRGVVEERRAGSVRTMRLDECHTVAKLRRRVCWSVVITGPARRSWGFYLREGWISERAYDETFRRELWNEVG